MLTVTARNVRSRDIVKPKERFSPEGLTILLPYCLFLLPWEVLAQWERLLVAIINLELRQLDHFGRWYYPTIHSDDPKEKPCVCRDQMVTKMGVIWVEMVAAGGETDLNDDDKSVRMGMVRWPFCNAMMVVIHDRIYLTSFSRQRSIDGKLHDSSLKTWILKMLSTITKSIWVKMKKVNPTVLRHWVAMTNATKSQ